jgi:uncharacterized protein (DUF1684 family)
MLRFATAALLAATLPAASDSSYKAEIEKWRQDREDRLKTPEGWLSVAGLTWLVEGENRIGSAAGNRVQLPPGLPAQAGSIVLQGKTVTLRAATGVTVNGKPVQSPTVLKADKTGSPDTIGIGRLKLTILDRGSKVGVRMRDPESEYRRNFKGLSWYPPDPKWVIKARFVPQPRKLTFAATAGDPQDMSSPGYVEWESGGRKHRLTPAGEGIQFFFIFRDRTAGRTTYGAGRFLYTAAPKDGYVTLDFNKAYNPPCVFTPYATCPLPPQENRLDLAIEAGEKMYAGH